MIKHILFITLISLPAVFAWNESECEEVDWNHPDCEWGNPDTSPPPPHNGSALDNSSSPSFRSGGGGHSRFTKGIWVLDNEIPPCEEYHYALSTPPRTYPGVPVVVEFGERVKKVCGALPTDNITFVRDWLLDGHLVASSYVDPPGYCFKWKGFA